MLTKDRLVRLCHARDQLRELEADAPSIDEIASVAAMSRYHFVRQYKAVFGETPVQTRTKARLDRAKALLTQAEHSVTEICMLVGFSSLGSFSALFAQRFGRSPTRYREQLRGSPEKAMPHCLALLRDAWRRQSQKTRSETVPEMAE